VLHVRETKYINMYKTIEKVKDKTCAGSDLNFGCILRIENKL